MRPGITDLSSLHFIDLASHIGSKDADANFESRVLPVKNRLRVQYVKEWSFWSDMKIIGRTLCGSSRVSTDRPEAGSYTWSGKATSERQQVDEQGIPAGQRRFACVADRGRTQALGLAARRRRRRRRPRAQHRPKRLAYCGAPARARVDEDARF